MNPDHIALLALSAPIAYAIRSVVESTAKVIIARQALRNAKPKDMQAILRGIGEAFGRGRNPPDPDA